MNNTIQKLAVLAALAGASGVALAANGVTPPPLPIGSSLVQPAPGLQEEEKKRFVRAHHHKMQNKRDFTKDDSEPSPAAANAAAPAAANANSGSAVKK